MEPVMRRFMEKHGIDAGALGAIWNGTIVYNKPFGWMDKSRTIGIRNDVMMRVASLTKLVTAAAVRKLEEGGRITLNDRVFDVGQPGGGILELQPWPSIGDPCIADITVESRRGAPAEGEGSSCCRRLSHKPVPQSSP